MTNELNAKLIYIYRNANMPRNTHRQYFNNYVSMADEDNLAQEKLNELKNCFSSFDRNGDGTISASEFQNALIRMNIYISGDVCTMHIFIFILFYREAETVDPRNGHPVPQGDSSKSFVRFWG